MSTNVEKIKNKLDIVDVVGSYVKLEKSGVNFKAKCPFHNEKTPSFFVSPSRGGFYCFGCGAKGDIFSFVEQFEGLDFMGALRVLADRAGVPLERENPIIKNERERLDDVLESATLFFESKLEENSEAHGYITKRGLTPKTLSEWRVGYAPDGWRALHGHLLGQKFTDKEMLQTGLIKKSENEGSGEKYYDTFRGRIMFPIFDTSGRVIAFSGRILKDAPDTAKYLNSPETDLFKKSEVLYGLHKAKLVIRKLDYSILVEGQMDLLMAEQAGFENTVASSGTALTELHLARLKRLSNRVIIAFDGDTAGFAAADRSATLAMGLGMEVKLAALPKGDDPADLIRKNPGAWREHLKNAKHIVDFHLDLMLADQLDDRKLGVAIRTKILPYVALISSSIEQSHFISKIAEASGVRPDALWEDLKKAKPIKIGQSESGQKKEVSQIRSLRKDFIERRLFGILYWQKSIDVPILDVEALQKQIIAISGKEWFDKLDVEMKPLKNDLLFEAEAFYGTKDLLDNDMPELLLNFEEDVLKQKFVRLMDELHKSEKSKDHTRAATLLKECQEMGAKINELSKKKSLNNNY